MKKCIFILVLLISIYSSSGQDNEAVIDTSKVSPNVLNISILGNGAYLSMNLERRFTVNKSFFLYPQIGLGYNEEFSISVPCLFGSCDPSLSKELFSIFYYNITAQTPVNKVFKYLEFGVGSSHGIGLRHNTTTHILYSIVGLRVHLSKKGNFKLSAYIPFYGYNDDYILFIPVGITVGFYL